ncbi:MAG TPA: hypothetical protein DD827_08840 [Gammaproteobacteria bacterium]|nr:hypothetical protein [Gammaproteobacteria bacterium]
MSNEHESAWLQSLYNPLFLYFDDTLVLHEVTGDGSFYGLSELKIKADKLVDFLPELVGIDTCKPSVIPLITLSNAAAVNIHIKPQENGFCLLITDANASVAEMQALQQQTHVEKLKIAESQQLQQKIEILNEELVQASRAKSLFISGMSHEFRTPIMGMLGNIAWVEKQLSHDKSSMQKLNAIETNATYLLGLVDNLLQHGKLSSKQLKITRVGVYPKHILHSVLETMLPLAEKRSILLAHEIKFPRTLNLLIDEYHLRRILYNLLGNAIKFTDVGSVLLSAEYKDSHLHISVQDTGIGIPADEMEKILLPFTRASNVVHRRGIGLGLSYANEIIKAMGGDLKVESQSDSGTVVTLILPATKALEQVASEKHSGTQNITGQVVLIEDSTEIASLYSYYFHEMGIDLTTVSNAADLHALLRKFTPDILLVDHILGEENGIDLVEEIRVNGFDGYVALLTASIDVDQRLENKAINAGCDEFIQKPAEVERLVETVKSQLHRIKNASGDRGTQALISAYLKTFTEKCASLISKLEHLKQSPDHPDNLKPLKILVHKISGSAGSYGFPDISIGSIELERVIDRYEKTNDRQTSKEIEAGCYHLVRELEQYID